MEIDELQAKLGLSAPERIGRTPLLRLTQPVRGLRGVTLLGKAEWTNPSGSAKDRPAAAMLRDAIARGLLTPAKTLLEATSGNAGIAFAMLGAALGFSVRLAVPFGVSPETKGILLSYGAEVDWTDPEEGLDGAIRRARELAGNHPERYCYVDQFSNDANWLAHYNTTGPEIWEQTAGRITHFVAGIGSSGTFMGAARRLKEHNALLQAFAVRPDAPLHGLRGLAHGSVAIIPAIYNPHLADRVLEVETGAAHSMVRQLAREEGLRVGISSAAAIVASVRIAQEEAAAGREAVLVAVLPDGADR